MSLKYYIVDVFAEKKFAGNRLAVIMADKKISSEEMQDIAYEFNFSETTFIHTFKKDADTFKVRIFTPKNEVPFAGHPVLGTAFIIKNELLGKKCEKVILDLKAGMIPVVFKKHEDREVLWMKQIKPEFGDLHKVKDFAEILGLNKNDFDLKFPIQEVTTGLRFIIIPLCTLDAVKRAKTNMDNYSRYFKYKNPLPLFIFCGETYEKQNQLNCRMFADIFGILEDPATGSANGCLAGYLVKYRYFNDNKIDIRVEQGYEINRKSILYLKAEDAYDGIDVNVGGSVEKIAEGKLI